MTNNILVVSIKRTVIIANWMDEAQPKEEPLKEASCS
jgi:hypothetical protein